MIPFDKKIIALDFDDTFTVNENLWSIIITMFKEKGYDISFVTYRFASGFNEDIEYWGEELDIPIIYCNGCQKQHVIDSLGLKVLFWIDDSPQTIVSYKAMNGMIRGCERNNDIGE